MLSARSLPFALAFASLAPACNTPSEASVERSPGRATTTPAAPDPAEGQAFGQALGDRQLVALADIVASPERFVGQVVRTSGSIQAVCQHRGCWMDIGSADESHGRIHVRSLDHSLSFPREAVGKTAEVEGEVQAMPGVPGCGSPSEGHSEANAEDDGTPACGVAAGGRRVQLAVRGAVIR